MLTPLTKENGNQCPALLGLGVNVLVTDVTRVMPSLGHPAVPDIGTVSDNRYRGNTALVIVPDGLSNFRPKELTSKINECDCALAIGGACALELVRIVEAEAPTSQA